MSINYVLDILRNPRVIIKLLQLALAISCTALADSSLFDANNLHKAAFLHIVYGGYILITTMEVLRIFMGDRTRQILELFWSAVGAVLWVSAAGVDFEFYTYLDSKKVDSYYLQSKLTSALLGLFNSIVYIAEFGIVFRWG